MEYMSAVTGTFDEAKPSVFELLAEQQLSGLIPPSLRYLLAVATHRHPRYLLRVLNSFDELYACLMLAVERYYLTTHGGGFTEHFYGLKRERALVNEIPRAQLAAPALVRESLALRTSDVRKNLAVMVGLPYLKRKLDESYDVNAPRALLGASYTQLPPRPTIKQRLLHYYRWFLRNVYPSVNAAYYFSLLAFNLAYLFDNTQYHSPFMWLIGTRMRRLGEADYRAIAQLTEGGSAAKGGSRPGITSLLHPRTLYPRLLDSLKLLLPASIFALKFLEWWHASDFARQLSRKATEGLVLPPPLVSGLSRLSTNLGPESQRQQQTSSHAETEEPKVLEKDQKESPDTSTPRPDPPIASSSLLPILTVPQTQDSSLCPICEEEIQTATACQTGFVFCYTCIHRWVEGTHSRQEQFMAEGDKVGKWESGQGRCAVTGRRVLGGTEGLRRIMV